MKTDWKRLCALLLFGLLLCCPAPAWADELNVGQDNQNGLSVADLDTLGLEQAIDEVAQYLGQTTNSQALRELWQGVQRGELKLDVALLGQAVVAVFLREIDQALRILGQLLVLSVFGLLLVHLPRQSVAELARRIVYLALFGVVLQVLVLAGGAAAEAVELMSSFLYALLPVLLTLLVSLGAPTAVGLYHPLLLGAVGSALHLLRIFVLPLLYISGALTVGGQISPQIKLNGLAKLCRDVAMGIFGIMLTVFGALLGLLGLGGSVIDGLGLKAVKSAAGAFIPLVGRTLADTLDTVISTALVLKSLIGVLGLVVLLLICIVPAVKILLLSLLLRLTAALVEPLGDSTLAAAMNSMGQVVLLFFAVTAISGLFFFFIVSITIGMGNLVVALR
jgi:stage III sporulation protein AE